MNEDLQLTSVQDALNVHVQCLQNFVYVFWHLLPEGGHPRT